MMRWAISGIFLWVVAGCATLESETEEPLTIAETSDQEIKGVAFKNLTGKTDYTYNGQKYAAEWISCEVNDGKATVLVMHGEDKGYKAATFCAGWLAQTFLSENINVIAVNRPGFENSNGMRDFAGPGSIAAVKAGVQGAKAAGSRQPTGIWGYATGATAASLVSRELEGIKDLILGGGVYDLDDTMRVTKDGDLKKMITSLYQSGGDAALEERSIAYDVEGLPKEISLYHGKQDTAVPARQATVFRDTLVSSEYAANLQIIDGVAHEIPVITHQKILKVLARSML